ncbi:hypothetical protein, partial [Pseudomonas viridiflava]|uniref:hypothetical protein n=1 Tax=Pseudomonas viridiflava TaxID=33069 RepID=UPI00196793FD
LGQFDVLQGIRVADRQRLVISDSFHDGSSVEKVMNGSLAISRKDKTRYNGRLFQYIFDNKAL